MQTRPEDTWGDLHTHLSRSNALIDDLYRARHLSTKSQPHASGFATTYPAVSPWWHTEHAHQPPHQLAERLVRKFPEHALRCDLAKHDALGVQSVRRHAHHLTTELEPTYKLLQVRTLPLLNTVMHVSMRTNISVQHTSTQYISNTFRMWLWSGPKRSTPSCSCTPRWHPCPQTTCQNCSTAPCAWCATWLAWNCWRRRCRASWSCSCMCGRMRTLLPQGHR